jgi:hypothetical protein
MVTMHDQPPLRFQCFNAPREGKFSIWCIHAPTLAFILRRTS